MMMLSDFTCDNKSCNKTTSLFCCKHQQDKYCFPCSKLFPCKRGCKSRNIPLKATSKIKSFIKITRCHDCKMQINQYLTFECLHSICRLCICKKSIEQVKQKRWQCSGNVKNVNCSCPLGSALDVEQYLYKICFCCGNAMVKGIDLKNGLKINQNCKNQIMFNSSRQLELNNNKLMNLTKYDLQILLIKCDHCQKTIDGYKRIIQKDYGSIIICRNCCDQQNENRSQLQIIQQNYFKQQEQQSILKLDTSNSPKFDTSNSPKLYTCNSQSNNSKNQLPSNSKQKQSNPITNQYRQVTAKDKNTKQIDKQAFKQSNAKYYKNEEQQFEVCADCQSRQKLSEMILSQGGGIYLCKFCFINQRNSLISLSRKQSKNKKQLNNNKYQNNPPFQLKKYPSNNQTPKKVEVQSMKMDPNKQQQCFNCGRKCYYSKAKGWSELIGHVLCSFCQRQNNQIFSLSKHRSEQKKQDFQKQVVLSLKREIISQNKSKQGNMFQRNHILTARNRFLNYQSYLKFGNRPELKQSNLMVHRAADFIQTLQKDKVRKPKIITLNDTIVNQHPNQIQFKLSQQKNNSISCALCRYFINPDIISTITVKSGNKHRVCMQCYIQFKYLK